jgi:iron complex outermembrane recepter protein
MWPHAMAVAQSTGAEPQGPNSLPARPPEEPLEVLRFLKEETVITAIRHEQPISEAPSNIYVITDEDIRQSGAIDLPTILRRVPGIDVVQMTAADFNVSARGDNQPRANKMLVLVDGRSIYLDEQGEVLWKMIPMTLPEIKRIEVLKGPVSALYGFNAFDGVVNIITKSPEEIRGATFQFGGGTYGTISGSAIYAGTQGKLGYRVSAGWDQTNEWQDRDALAFRAYKFNIQTEYALPSQSKLLVSGGLVNSNRYDGPIVDVVAVSQEPSIGYANILYERPNFFVRGYWAKVDQPGEIGVNPNIARFFQVTDRNGNPNQFRDANTYDLEAQHAFEFGTANRLTYGVNYRHLTVSSNFLDEFSNEDRLGLYIQDEWRATSSFTIIAGLRYDLHSEIAGTFSPRLALVYKLAQNHTLRVATSMAYRPPTTFETHTDSLGIIRLPSVPFPIRRPLQGSEGLDPERIISYDAGYQGWFFKHRLRLRADLFFNHISDLITSLPPTFVNGGEADIYGGEIGIEFLATPWLSGFANYAYQNFNQTFTGTAQRGGPHSRVNVGLRGEWTNGLNGEVALHYVGPAVYPINEGFSMFVGLPGSVQPPNTRLSSYNLLNLRAAYRFWDEKAEVALSAFNALDDRHKEHPLGNTIGSRVMGWLTVRY